MKLDARIESYDGRTLVDLMADLMNIDGKTRSNHKWLSVTTTVIASGKAVASVSSEWTPEKRACMDKANIELAKHRIPIALPADDSLIQVVCLEPRLTSGIRVSDLLTHIARWSHDHDAIAVACAHTDETASDGTRLPVHMHVICEANDDESLHDYFRHILKAR